MQYACNSKGDASTHIDVAFDLLFIGHIRVCVCARDHYQMNYDGLAFDQRCLRQVQLTIFGWPRRGKGPLLMKFMILNSILHKSLIPLSEMWLGRGADQPNGMCNIHRLTSVYTWNSALIPFGFASIHLFNDFAYINCRGQLINSGSSASNSQHINVERLAYRKRQILVKSTPDSFDASHSPLECDWNTNSICYASTIWSLLLHPAEYAHSSTPFDMVFVSIYD